MFEFTIDEYNFGMKRLMTKMKKIVVSKTNTPNEISENVFKVKKNVCVICGYIWDVTKCKDSDPIKCPSCRSSLWNCTDLHRHVCKCCSYRWASKTADPVMCPKCKSTLWNDDVKRYECQSCGCIQDYRIDRSIPDCCPKCGSEKWTCNSIGCTCKKCGYVGRLSVNRIGRCPVCKTTLSIDNSSEKKNEKTVGTMAPSILSDKIVGILNEDVDDIRKMSILVNEERMDYCDAEVVIRCFQGERAFDVARNMDLTLDKVMRVVSKIHMLKELQPNGEVE